MKYLLFFFSVIGGINLFAQTTIESDYVLKGETFRFDLPAGFSSSEMAGLIIPDATFYISDEAIEAQKHSKMDSSLINNGIMTGHIPYAGIDIVILGSMFASGMMGEMDGIEIIGDPSYTKIKIADDREQQFGTLKLKIATSEAQFESVYLSATEIGDFYFLFATYSMNTEGDSIAEVMSNDIINSFQIVSTDKPNQLLTVKQRERKELNNGVYTELHPDYITFLDAEDSTLWSRNEASDYMITYSFRNSHDRPHGHIHMFSAGPGTASSSQDEILKILQKSLSEYGLTTINKRRIIKGPEFDFIDQAWTNNGKSRSGLVDIYTTTYEDELIVVFAVVGDYAKTDFYTNTEFFMKSLSLITKPIVPK